VLPVHLLVDATPVVELVEPAEDIVFAAPAGVLPLRAVARDDHGVADLRLTYIRTRGSGESYSFEEGEWDWDAQRRDGRGMVGELRLDLAAAGFRPGDVVHVRAVARDRNDVTGPGEGVSATRVLRVAQPDEMHTATTLIGFPLEVERNPVLSQRMLILMTERLRDRARRIGRGVTLREGAGIAHEQGRLRMRVGEVIFERSTGGMPPPEGTAGFEDEGGAPGHDHAGAVEDHGHDHPRPAAADPAAVEEAASEATGRGTVDELGHRHDESPILHVNRTLLEAYNAMWAAERVLRQGEPAAALPHQHEALRLLQEAQQAERVYARGRPAPPAIDVDATRGTGPLDEADPAPRSRAGAAAAAPRWERALEETLARVAALPVREAAAELTSLGGRLLADRAVPPEAAELVARAAVSMERGERAAALTLLRRARAALAVEDRPGPGLPLPVPEDEIEAEYLRRIGGSR
jgi:hypothetical protein